MSNPIAVGPGFSEPLKPNDNEQEVFIHVNNLHISVFVDITGVGHQLPARVSITSVNGEQVKLYGLRNGEQKETA